MTEAVFCLCTEWRAWLRGVCLAADDSPGGGRPGAGGWCLSPDERKQDRPHTAAGGASRSCERSGPGQGRRAGVWGRARRCKGVCRLRPRGARARALRAAHTRIGSRAWRSYRGRMRLVPLSTDTRRGDGAAPRRPAKWQLQHGIPPAPPISTEAVDNTVDELGESVVTVCCHGPFSGLVTLWSCSGKVPENNALENRPQAFRGKPRGLGRDGDAALEAVLRPVQKRGASGHAPAWSGPRRGGRQKKTRPPRSGRAGFAERGGACRARPGVARRA